VTSPEVTTLALPVKCSQNQERVWCGGGRKMKIFSLNNIKFSRDTRYRKLFLPISRREYFLQEICSV